MKGNIFLTLVLSHFSLSVASQCLNSCGCDLLPPVSGHRAATQLTYQSNIYKPFSSEELTHITGNDPVYSVRSQHSIQLLISVPLRENIVIQAAFPFLFSMDNLEAFKHADEQVHITAFGNISGFGDATVQAGYRFFSNADSCFELTLLAGIKMPTGQREQFSSDGLLAPLHLQAGSGSWDPLLQLWSEYQNKHHRINFRIAFRKATTALNHNMGSSLHLSLTTLRAFRIPTSQSIRNVLLQGGMYLLAQQRMSMPPYHHLSHAVAEQQLYPFSNSGHMRLMAAVGTGLQFRDEVRLPVQVLFPFYQRLQGQQVSLRWQLQIGLDVKL
ncbi:MAG: hypothetical protein NZL95_08690 [Chitinophagales bacterium]|nr:hypothetical protein [Chitinophagales bacterium]MDW8428613.1 hypothetical protein [Chitinophagales bacterium]